MPEKNSSPRWFDRFLLRGESVVAGAGLCAAAVLVLSLGGSAWWSYHSQAMAATEAERDRVEAASRVLATGVQSILSAGDGAAVVEVSAARRMVLEASARYGLAVCRVEMPDGTLLLDADVRKGVKALPIEWPAAPATAAAAAENESSIGATTSMEIMVAGRGLAKLVIAPGPAPASSSSARWEFQAGLGLIGTLALGAMLLFYRGLRKRLRGLLALREALQLAGAESASAESLRLSDEFGEAASTWNAILAQREAVSAAAVVGKADRQMSASGWAETDVTSACDALPTGMVLVDEHCTIKYLNGAAAVFLGSKREDALGKTLDQFGVEADVVRMATSAAKGLVRTRAVFEASRVTAGDIKLRGPSEQDAERRGQKKFSSGVLRFVVRPVRRDDAGTATIIIDDVTQQKAADEARNSFVAQAAHELRTPLTSIRLYVEQLIEEQEALATDPGAKVDPASRATAINAINSEARRLERIVGDMLSVAEIEAGSLKLHDGDVRLGPLFDEIRAEFEPQAKAKQMGLMFELPPKWPQVKGDRDKLALALHNLIGNAVKYTLAGGRVSVRVSYQPGMASGAGGTGPMLVCEVIDTGIGIKQEECELIFEKFYRAKDKRIAGITGSGLGLALAREVTRMHGGDISVQSQIDRGTTFTLTLPAQAA